VVGTEVAVVAAVYAATKMDGVAADTSPFEDPPSRVETASNTAADRYLRSDHNWERHRQPLAVAVGVASVVHHFHCAVAEAAADWCTQRIEVAVAMTVVLH
jgi:hypothetical protein